MLRRVFLTGIALVSLQLGCSDDDAAQDPTACVKGIDPSQLDTNFRDSDQDPSIKVAGDLEPVDAWCPGSLWRAKAPFGTLHIAYLKGTHEEMGYQYGRMLGGRILEVWDVYARHVEEASDGQLTGEVFGNFLDSVWSYLEPYVPSELQQEIDAAARGAQDAGYAVTPDVLQRFVALSNVSDYDGDLDTLLSEIVGGHPPWPADKGQVLKAYLRERRLSCSFFAAWGPRTQDGHLLSSRVLDWDSDSGLQDYSLLTIYDPDNGRAHVTFGYIGLVGALGGMNDAGVSVAEIGSTNTVQTLLGTPWTLRNRLVLEHSSNLDEALAIMTDLEKYPNTVGYNFMVAWGDPEGGGTGAEAAAVETNALYSSIFRGARGVEKERSFYLVDGEGRAICLKDSEGNLVSRDDMRMQEGEYVDLATDESEYTYPGRPLEHAIFRGDASFTKEIRVTQTAARGPGDKNHGKGDPNRGDGWMYDSGSYQERYLRYYCMIRAFQDGTGCTLDGEEFVAPGEQKLLSLAEGVRLVRAAAMKGNIYIALMDNTALLVAVAYESGTGDTWRRAADNDFLLFDLGTLLDEFRALGE